jgi:thiol:disulfide interchange protein
MFGLGVPELLILVVFAAVPVWLLWVVLGRAGLPRGYAFLVVVPYIGVLAALGVLAFAKWPAAEQPAPAVQPPPSPHVP